MDDVKDGEEKTYHENGQLASIFYYKKDCAVDEHHHKLPKNYAHGKGTADNLWINHYWTKSYAEFKKRREWPNAGDGRAYTNLEGTFKSQDTNDIVDLCAQQWAPAVKRMIEYRGKQNG